MQLYYFFILIHVLKRNCIAHLYEYEHVFYLDIKICYTYFRRKKNKINIFTIK